MLSTEFDSSGENIAELRKAKDLLTFQLNFEKLVADIYGSFTGLPVDKIDAGLNNALELIGRFLKVDRCCVFLLSEDKKTINNTFEWCAEDIEPQAENLKITDAGSIPWWMEKLNDKYIYIPRVSELPPEAEYEKQALLSQSIQSLIAIPMMAGNSLIGFMSFDSIKAEKSWGKDNIYILRIVSEIFINTLERKCAIETLQREKDLFKYLSFHDKLTGLYNRAFFEEELKRLDTQRQLPVSLIIGDINGLKMANDAFGHRGGDVLLQKISNILKLSCRKEDIIARWGGDEFTMILPATGNKIALEICNRIKDACSEYESGPIKLDIALGCATKENNSQDIQQILKDAEDMMYRHKLLDRKSVRSTIVSSLEKTLYEKSIETEEHAQRIQRFCTRIGQEIGLSANEIDELRLLSILHDIGKIAISNNIFAKTGSLTPEEMDEMKKHCEIGYRIAESTYELSHISKYILFHHERWDGLGYPQGLKGNAIPKLSRILSIVDTYDVLTHGRPYKKTLNHKEAVKEIKKCSGSQFDPHLVDVFIKII